MKAISKIFTTDNCNLQAFSLNSVKRVSIKSRFIAFVCCEAWFLHVSYVPLCSARSDWLRPYMSVSDRIVLIGQIDDVGCTALMDSDTPGTCTMGPLMLKP